MFKARWSVAGLAAFALTLGSAEARPADRPDPLQPGILIDSQAKTIGQWALTTEAFWCAELGDCTYLRFERPDRVAIALTQPIRRNARGGVETQRITSLFLFALEPHESVQECGLPDKRVVLGIVNEVKRQARLYTVDGRRLAPTIVRYGKEGPPCEVGED